MTRRLPTAFASPALLLLAAACASAPAGPAAELRAGLSRLDEALAMRHEPGLWEQVGPAAAEAAALLQPAVQSGVPDAAAAYATARVLVAWQALTEAGWRLEAEAGWPAARDAAAAALQDWLGSAAGDVSEAHAMRVVLLLESGHEAQAGTSLAAALVAFPASSELNDLSRAHRGLVPDPAGLAERLESAAGRDEAAAEMLATQGHLLLAAGLAAEDAGDAAGATSLYERGGQALALARKAAGQRASDWVLRQRLADCMANAGRLRLAAAQAQLADAGLAAAVPDLQAAEADWGEALAALPDDDESRAGLAATADSWYAGGDMAGARDAFGRLARRFDIAEWWNNTAFLSRETGQYEEAFAAYERCMQLEPDNARYVNDTALILLYHLQRDLDRAEAMFRRSIELGRAVCDNPFSDDAVRDENFLAYTDAMLNLALLMASDGRLDQAASLCDQLLALAPDRQDARSLRDQIAAARHGAPPPDAPTPAAPRNPGP